MCCSASRSCRDMGILKFQKPYPKIKPRKIRHSYSNRRRAESKIIIIVKEATSFLCRQTKVAEPSRVCSCVRSRERRERRCGRCDRCYAGLFRGRCRLCWWCHRSLQLRLRCLLWSPEKGWHIFRLGIDPAYVRCPP
jgi:hypothetical protein